jgi:hypothetical protein
MLRSPIQLKGTGPHTLLQVFPCPRTSSRMVGYTEVGVTAEDSALNLWFARKRGGIRGSASTRQESVSDSYLSCGDLSVENAISWGETPPPPTGMTMNCLLPTR